MPNGVLRIFKDEKILSYIILLMTITKRKFNEYINFKKNSNVFDNCYEI